MRQDKAEHRFLTVLFCDLVNSTGLQYQIDSEQFAEFLSRYRNLVGDVIARHSGHVAQWQGDGVLALFGWPTANGHDAELGILAGLEICDTIARDGGRTLGNADDVAVRVAIETGWVLVGKTSDMGDAGGLVGHAPNVASRLQRLAPRNGVVIGQVTIALVRDRFELDPVDASGLPLPVQEQAARVIRRFLTPQLLANLRGGRGNGLVGREDLLATLRHRYEQAASGFGQVVVLSGDPGIGKSSLAASFAASVQTQSEVFAITCSAASTHSAFQPWVEPFRAAAGLSTESSEADVSAVARQLGEGVPSGAEAVATLLGLRVSEVDPAGLRRATFRLIRSFIFRLAAERPVLVIADDVQWADASSLELLAQLADEIGQHRAILLILHHADWGLGWSNAPNLTELGLPPLGRTAAAELVAVIAPELEPAVQAAIVSRAEGVPFFLEEFARAMSPQGPALPRLPGSISQLLTARLDSVTTAYELVELAAVYGRDVDLDFLAELVQRPRDALLPEVEELLVRRVMVERRWDGIGTKLAFRHALLAAAAYDAMTRSHRANLHRRVATALQKHYAHLESQAPEDLGRHFALGGEKETAADYFRRGSANALATAAFTEAINHAQKAFELVESASGDSGDRARLSALVLLGEGLSGKLGYASSDVRAAFERASHLALGLGSAAELLPALRGLTAFYQIRGPLQRAYELGSRTAQVARLGGDPVAIADAERRLGWCRLCQGQLTEARTLVESAMARVDGVIGTKDATAVVNDTTVRGPGILAMIAFFVDGADAALSIIERIAGDVVTLPRPMGRIYSLGFTSLVYQICGDAEKAAHFAGMSGEAARRHGNLYWTALSDIVCGWAKVISGRDVAEGLRQIRQGAEDYERSESVLLHPYALWLLAHAEETVGETEGALNHLARAAALAQSIGAQLYHPLLQAARARILLTRQDPAGRAAVADARSMALELGAYAQVRRIDQLTARHTGANHEIGSGLAY